MGARRSSKTAFSKKAGANLKYDISLTLEEAFYGVTKIISFKTALTCEACTGKGSLDNNSTSSCPTCRGSGVTRSQQGFFFLKTLVKPVVELGTSLKTLVQNVMVKADILIQEILKLRYLQE